MRMYETVGAKFWLSVMQGLKAWGVEDTLIAVADVAVPAGAVLSVWSGSATHKIR